MRASITGLLLLQLVTASAVARAAEPTLEEKAVLEQGEISTGAHVGGAALAWFVGFGSGQAVQGRFMKTGWIFLGLDLLGLGLVISGAVDCAVDYQGGPERTCSGFGAIAGGGLILAGSRIGGILDAAIGPALHNARYRELRGQVTWMPVKHGPGALGLSWSF